MRAAARSAAARIGLPLEVRHVGDAGLERRLAELVGATQSAKNPASASATRPG